MALSFEWDEGKAESNLKAHGVSFREATTVFADPLSTSVFPTFGVCSWYRTQSEATKSVLSVRDSQPVMSENNMKKQIKRKARSSDEMRTEYDFSKGVRGKHCCALCNRY